MERYARKTQGGRQRLACEPGIQRPVLSLTVLPWNDLSGARKPPAGNKKCAAYCCYTKYGGIINPINLYIPY